MFALSIISGHLYHTWHQPIITWLQYFSKYKPTRGGGYKAILLYSIIFCFLYLNNGSWAAETPGKYEHDWNYLTYTFAKSKFPVTEKLANGALVTPTPGQY